MNSIEPAAFVSQAEHALRASRAVLEPTPLQFNAFLSARYDCSIFLKREDLTPVRSYKLRGAFNFFRKAIEGGSKPDQMFVCASAGNHAQGFAFACQHFGVQGIIFMPVTTPQQKISKTTVFGGEHVEIKLVGDFFDDSNAAAIAYAHEHGALFVPPFDHPDIIEGQAGVGLEILAQIDRPIDILIVPVGGGGLAAGVSQVMEARSPGTRIVFVEPAGAASFKASLKHGSVVKLDTIDGFVDGASVAKMGQANFARLRRFSPDDVVLVPEDHLCETMIEMLNVEGIVLEPAGALEIDCLRWLPPDEIKGKTVVCLTSGGNFDFERLPEVKERALKASGRKKYFILRLPQRPGALREFLDLLGPEDDIARFEYLKKSARNFGSVLIGVETAQPENFNRLFSDMAERGLTFQDITDDETVANFIL